MRAMVLKEYNRPLEMVEMDKPGIRSDEILLKVRASGICHTDLKIIKGEIPPPIVTLPHILGHEVAGEVVAVGEFVSDLNEGDVGVVYSYITCRECQWCLKGRENLCPNLKRVGFELNGGFEEYLRIPAYALCPFNRDLPLHEMAILADAVGTPYHAITQLADIEAGQTVLIVGAGGLGIHAVQIAKLCGASVIVVDKDQNALNLAQEFGADGIFLPEEALERIKDWTGGQGADAVIEIVGFPETLSWSLPSLKGGGTLVLVGYAPGRPFPLDTMAMHYHEYRIMGARFVTKAELKQVIKLVEEGRIKPVVTKTFPFERANEAIEALRRKTTLGRTVLTLE